MVWGVSLGITLVDVEDDRCREIKKEERHAAGLPLLPAPSTGHRLHMAVLSSALGKGRLDGSSLGHLTCEGLISMETSK